MPFEIDEIKQIRKKLGLTQSELAKQANVSQSLIAKVEAGKLDPTYSNAKKIFDALNLLSKKQELKAEDIMKRNIISVRPGDDLKEAIKKMKHYNISQMPVVDEHNCVGLVSEAIVLEALTQNKGHKIKDIMGEAPPVVSKNTSIDVISNLLRFYPIVIVSFNGKLEGVITKSDIIEKMYK